MLIQLIEDSDEGVTIVEVFDCPIIDLPLNSINDLPAFVNHEWHLPRFSKFINQTFVAPAGALETPVKSSQLVRGEFYGFPECPRLYVDFDNTGSTVLPEGNWRPERWIFVVREITPLSSTFFKVR